MEYYANFAAQQTQLMHDIVGKNKRQITKDIREIASGNRHAGNKASWYVYHKEGENPICDAFGIIDEQGINHRVHEYEGNLMY